MTTRRKFAALVADVSQEREYFVMPCKLPDMKSKFGTCPAGPWRRPPKDDNSKRSRRILVADAAFLRSFDDCLGQGERHV
jgi:hypothetical protein